MAKLTSFKVQCGGAEHTVTIGTVMIPDPDHAGLHLPADKLFEKAVYIPAENEISPYTVAKEKDPAIPAWIPAPIMEFPDHCGCPDHYHCTRACDGQAEIEAAVLALQMGAPPVPSCAQFYLEFIGEAAGRLEKRCWEPIELS